VGINTFSRNYGKYRQEAVEATNPTADNYYAHNNFLHIAGEMGAARPGHFPGVFVFGAEICMASFRKHSDLFLKACFHIGAGGNLRLSCQRPYRDQPLLFADSDDFLVFDRLGLALGRIRG
jgi:hypothetical protein